MTKVALVTAGGSGMGAAVARRLAADGYRVGVLSSSGKGEALARGARRLRRHRLEPVERGPAAPRRGRERALGADRRARQQRRPRAEGATLGDRRRGLAPRARDLPDERDPGDAPRRAGHARPKGGRHRQHLDRLGVRAVGDVPDLRGVPGGPRGLHEDLRRRPRRRQRAHEQRPARLGRQPARGDRRGARACRWAATGPSRRSPPPSPSWSRTARPTSPGRTCASTED